MSKPLDIEEATTIARNQIAALDGFDDISFRVIASKNSRRVPIKKRDWAGQYVVGSIDSDKGLIVLVNVSKHEDKYQLVDTICHEVGHGIWELLDEKDKQRWIEKHCTHPWGAEEAFADDFMRLAAGERFQMNDLSLFMEITKVN